MMHWQIDPSTLTPAEALSDLARLMSDISEATWFAGWLIGLEFRIWEEVLLPAGERQLFCPCTGATLIALAERAGCWVMWSTEVEDTISVPLSQWREQWQEMQREQWREMQQATVEGRRPSEAPVREVILLFDYAGRTLLWHVAGASAAYIPDSLDLWAVIWEHRSVLSGMAHTHPWTGEPVPSMTDMTTFSAIERGLGKKLLWPVVTTDKVGYYKWAGPGPLDYGLDRSDKVPLIDLAGLRRRSGI